MTKRTEHRRRAARLLAVLGAALAAVGVASPRDAQAHELGYDAVDGCEIRAEDETSFDVERSTATIAWEALKGDNCVDLLGDVWHATADLEWKDANRSDVDWIGMYSPEFGADDIHLNAHYMNDGRSQCSRNEVAMHELGHAHGLAHSFSGQVMSEFFSGFDVCTLQAHDIADYESLWGSRNPPPRPGPTLCPDCVDP